MSDEEQESKNIAVAVWRRLGFCECGRPEDALAKMRDALKAIKAVSDMHRSDIECYPQGVATPAMKSLHAAESAACGADDGARYLMYYTLDKAGLTEHGGSVPGWPTDDGVAFLKHLEDVNQDDWMREEDDPTDEELEAWRAENRRLLIEGWSISTNIMTDGTVEEWAIKGDQKIRRDIHRR